MQIESAWAISDSLLERTDLDMTEKVLLAVLVRLGGLEKPLWPRHEWLAAKLGIDESTVRRCLKRLIEKGEVVKLKRRWKIAQYALTGQYAHLSPGNTPSDSPGNTPTHIKLGQGKLRQIKEIIATAEPSPFIWNDYLEKISEDKNRHIQVVAFYFKEKGLKFDTLAKAQVAIRRHLRAAREVAEFSDSEIARGARKAEQEYPGMWTIETLKKVLTK